MSAWNGSRQREDRGAAYQRQVIYANNLVLPLQLVMDKRVTHFAKLVWGLLALPDSRLIRRARQQSELAEQLGVTTDGVRHAIRSLRQAGWLEVIRTAHGNRYIVLESPEPEARAWRPEGRRRGARHDQARRQTRGPHPQNIPT